MQNRAFRLLPLGVGALAAMALLAGCGQSTGGSATGSRLTGTIDIDGSSTVFPVAAALVEEFNAANPDVRITVNQAGTGSGFAKFARGETDIATASRPVTDAEVAELAKAGVEFVEAPIAFDGLSIVVNRSNTWLETVTTAELKAIWSKDSKVRTWNQVRPEYPNKPIALFGPTTGHGTYEYFNEAVNGNKANSRQDYQQCADYNTLVAGVSRDEGALGYVGYAYTIQNRDKLRVVPVDAGKGAVEPTPQTIRSNAYSPLSRPLLIYVSKKALDKPEVAVFCELAMKDGVKAVESQGYIALPDSAYALALEKIKNKRTGTVFQGATPGMPIDEMLKRESGK